MRFEAAPLRGAAAVFLPLLSAAAVPAGLGVLGRTRRMGGTRGSPLTAGDADGGGGSGCLLAADWDAAAVSSVSAATGGGTVGLLAAFGVSPVTDGGSGGLSDVISDAVSDSGAVSATGGGSVACGLLATAKPRAARSSIQNTGERDRRRVRKPLRVSMRSALLHESSTHRACAAVERRLGYESTTDSVK